MKHYYLVASLPTLALGEPPPWSGDEFLAACAHFTTWDQRAELRRALEGRWAEATTEFLRRWADAETQLRNALARTRAGKWSVDPTPFLHEHRGWNTYLERAVMDAYAKPNPLERELFLDHYRWKTLDEMTFRDAFGFGALVAYAIKLRLAARWASLTDERGREAVEKALGAMAVPSA